MGSNSSISRVNSDPSPTSTPTNKIKKSGVKPVPALWPTAPSLRPDTVKMAEACMEGDAEAIALRDSYQFQTNRATRIVTLTRDDGTEPTKDDLQSYYSPLVFGLSGSKVKPLSCEGRNKSHSEETEKDEHVTFARVNDAMPSQDSTGEQSMSSVEKEAAIELLLNESMAAFQLGEDHSTEDLCMHLKMLAYYRCEVSYKQLSLRNAGTELDLAHNFTAHAMKKIEAGKYQDRGIFSHWANVVFRRFADTELNKLTRENKVFCSLFEPYSDADSEDDKPTVSHSDKESMRLWSLDARQQKAIAAELQDMDPADRAFAEFRMQGLNQKQTAAKMGESAPTARKRQRRIRAVLRTVSPQAVQVDADPHPDATEGTCVPQAFSTGTLAEVGQ